MTNSVPQLDRDYKVGAYLSLPQLETIIAPQVIQQVFTGCQAW